MRFLLVCLLAVAPVFARAGDPSPSRDKTYEYTEAGKSVRIVIPEGIAVVRGILIVGPYAGGDSRDYYQQAWYREFMYLHGFAFLGASWVSSQQKEPIEVMQNAIRQIALDSGRPELVNAPYAATGFSAGGGLARRLMTAAPDKLIAAAIVGSTLKLPEITPAQLHTPVCVINGELEHGPNEKGGMAAVLAPVLAENRPKGALWGWLAVPGVGHEFAGQEVLAMPFLDFAVRLRYPADGDVRQGPLTLKPVAPESGWIADNITWSSLTKIAAAGDFRGDLATSSWLLNEDIAFIYRAYASSDPALVITSPDHLSAKSEARDAGSSVVLNVDDTKFAAWQKLELYDGAKKVDELAAGPARFTVKNLQPATMRFPCSAPTPRATSIPPPPS